MRGMLFYFIVLWWPVEGLHVWDRVEESPETKCRTPSKILGRTWSKSARQGQRCGVMEEHYVMPWLHGVGKDAEQRNEERDGKNEEKNEKNGRQNEVKDDKNEEKNEENIAEKNEKKEEKNENYGGLYRNSLIKVHRNRSVKTFSNMEYYFPFLSKEPLKCYKYATREDVVFYYDWVFLLGYVGFGATAWYVIGEFTRVEKVLYLFLPHYLYVQTRYNMVRYRSSQVVTRPTRIWLYSLFPFLNIDESHLAERLKEGVDQYKKAHKTTNKSRTKNGTQAKNDTPKKNYTKNDTQDETEMDEKELAAFGVSCKHRTIGFAHACLTLPFAVFGLLLDPCSSVDPACSLTPIWTLAGVITCSYFVWDVIVVIEDWTEDSVAFMAHAIISLTTFSSGLGAGDCLLAYYCFGFIILEISTPFLSLRYFSAKFGYTTTVYYYVTGSLFAGLFISARIMWAPFAIYFPLTYELYAGPYAHRIPFYPKLLGISMLPAFWVLNLYWASQIVPKLILSIRPTKVKSP